MLIGYRRDAGKFGFDGFFSRILLIFSKKSSGNT